MITLEQLALKVSETLKNSGARLVTAESCTGGGLSYLITSIAGCSLWFDRGFVTYSNSAKETCLGVGKKTLAEFGAVSEETVRAMAEGALRLSEADISIAITGIAGPDGGTQEKPVGTVWIASSRAGRGTRAEKYLFSGDRASVREQSIRAALELILLSC